MDALDVFEEAAEVGDVVGFVFEKLGMKRSDVVKDLGGP